MKKRVLEWVAAGVVLNDLPPEVVDSFYFHSHYYGSEQLAGSIVAAP